MKRTEKALLAKGIRPTEMRSKIYGHLKRKFYAVSMHEMQKVFIKKSETDKTANRTTFYRTLNLFEEKGIVHSIHDGTANAKYALSDENATGKNNKDLHMHFHCTDCGKTICLPDKLSKDSLPDNYEVNDVNLVLKGVCEKCKSQIVKT